MLTQGDHTYPILENSADDPLHPPFSKKALFFSEAVVLLLKDLFMKK